MSRLMKKRGKTVRNEKGEMNKDCRVKGHRNYYEQLYASNFNVLEKMDKFLD